MKKLLIEGWRGINHSYAMVNQHQILALANLGGFEIYHHDLPFRVAQWNEKDNGAGFSEEDARFLAGLSDLPPEQADVVYRICAPIQVPVRTKALAITFAITEIGLGAGMFADGTLPPSAYTSEGDLVVTSSRWSRDRLVDYGFAEQSLRVVGCGVDTRAFNPLSEEERALNRSGLGIDPDMTVFLNIGAPFWTKGGDLLIEAFARLHREHPRTRLILKDAQKLYGRTVKETLRELGERQPDLMSAALLSAISVIPGNMTQAELRQLYGISDRYVSPYRAEGFNLPVLEAMACGIPVIVTSGGSTDDFCHGDAVRRIPSTFHRGPLGGHENACWLDPHLPSLIELMRDAVVQGADRTALSAAAVEQAMQHSWLSAAKELALMAGLSTPSNARPVSERTTISEKRGPQATRARAMHLYCDGGFGNRFNTLVSGLSIAKAAGIQPIVVWPRNNWCGASFSELLSNDFNVIESELITYLPVKDKFHFFMTEDHLGMGVANKSPLQIQRLDEVIEYLNSDSRDIYYHSPVMPPFLHQDELNRQVQELKFNPEIMALALEFISTKGLDEYFGVQIRKTDFGSNGADDENLYDLIRNTSHKKFFVCSDDKQVEQRFDALPNVAIYAKRAHVEKLLEDGGWNSVTNDNSGRAYACNVNRNALSVIEALVDLIILSYSEIVHTSNSTFLRTALLIQGSRKNTEKIVNY